MTRSPEQRVREICSALPECEERPFGGHTDPAWRVRGKIFAQYVDNAYYGGRPSLVCKVAPGALAALGGEGERFFVPPYSGAKGWIGVRLDRSADWALIESLVRESYRMIAPKRLAATVGA